MNKYFAKDEVRHVFDVTKLLVNLIANHLFTDVTRFIIFVRVFPD